MAHTPVRVITVEREYGSHGGEFAHALAARLGWRLLDSELVEGAARIAGVDPKSAAKFDERLDPWYYRYGKVFWHDSVFAVASPAEEQFFDSERMLSLIRAGDIWTRPSRATACLWGAAQPARWQECRDAFTSLCTPLRAPRRNGLRARFRSQAQHAEQHLAASISAAPW